MPPLPPPPTPPSLHLTLVSPHAGKRREGVGTPSSQMVAAMTQRTPAWQGPGGEYQRPGACANQALSEADKPPKQARSTQRSRPRHGATGP